MDYNSLLTQRYSCRNYRTTPLSRQQILDVLEGARLAPSACNFQPWTFVVVTDPEVKNQILAISRPAFRQAPALIVSCGHHDKAWHRPADGKDHTDVDISIAVEHICLSAANLGLGTCWVCNFDVPATSRALGLPENVEPIALIPIGYPADETVPEKNRKTLQDIVRWEHF